MKIFHALVGYLTVTTLPFHPFAIASPLTASSIHYDGYVDIDHTTQNHIDDALMKQFLGTIAETCQTVTAQNYSDIALKKDVPGNHDILEARQTPVQIAIPVVGFILFLVADAVFAVIWIKSDNPVRGKDVESLVEHFY